jgi:hypothetical protein
MQDTRAAGYSPTIRKRALARQLVELRQGLHLTTTDVQRRLGWSATKLNWHPDPADRDIVYLETAIDHRMLEEPDELDRYRLKFDKLRAAALSPDDTRTYLQQNG